MIEAMATHYNPGTKSLDLSRYYVCPLFTDNQLFVPLNQPAVLLAVLNIVAQHTDLYGLSRLANNHIYLGENLIWIRRLFPDLKVLDLAGNKFSDLKELKCLSGYIIEVLNLEGNPLCDTDNSELSSRDSLLVTKFKMPISLDNCYPIPEGHNPELSNSLMSLVESFLIQYYERYDSQMYRQTVSEAYHENATFILSSSLPFKNVNGSLSEYLPEKNIINFLEKLPKSKHDCGSFVVDVPLANVELLQIVVNGVFAEETNDKHIFRSFCRTIYLVPVGSSWNIISEMFFITTESSKQFHVLKPKPTYDEGHSVYQGGMPISILQIQQMAPATTVNFQPDSQQQPSVVSPTTYTSLAVNQLSTEAPINLINDVNANYYKMSMIKSFSNKSGMNNKWAERCLEENEWDYARAASCFLNLKDKIPPTAFIYERI
ncbi:hypothetical protein AGLY_010948 [Aphis glycines]|uniref:NTF2 domain-containing protein n=1 Tax=Aphis glycines TaxID=307491 RepID=A0A6G0TC21_APHGL|nr:hypothetical protein AGLY_010948 [Aphis glycines]